jgi:3-isopropylmalate/(R)-2-methylmalate dehydratase large subunit
MNRTITEKILLQHCANKDIAPGDFIEARVDLVLANDVTAPIAIDVVKGLGVRGVFDKNKVALVPDHFTPNKDIKSAEQCKMMRDFAKEYAIRNYFELGKVGIEHALLPEQGLVMPGMLIIGADSHTCTYGALGAFATGVGSTDAGVAMATGMVWLKVPPTMRFIYKGKLKKWVGGKDIILYTIGKIGVDGATYKAMEFSGPVISALPVEERLSLCNMAIEAGGKSGIVAPDKATFAYAQKASRKKIAKTSFARWARLASDPKAAYEKTYEYDMTKIEPQVALPHLPSNVRPVRDVGKKAVDQVVIGSCTNGRMQDLRIAAKVLAGKKVARGIRLIVIPATQKIYQDAMREGLLKVFIEAGAVISPPTCGPCLGGHMGILAKGERCLATTNRNFLGRMGHPGSEVYLSGPAVAAATAIKGYICHPDEVQ